MQRNVAADIEQSKQFIGWAGIPGCQQKHVEDGLPLD
jgi:hypothetical protein